MNENNGTAKDMVFNLFTYFSECAAAGSKAARSLLLTKRDPVRWKFAEEPLIITFMLCRVEMGDQKAINLLNQHLPKLLKNELPMPDVRIEKTPDGAIVEIK